MDFSEIIVAIIIGLVILAINSVGSKKQQSSKNQPGRQPGRPIVPGASTPSPVREEENRDTPTPLTLDEIFRELRRAHEEEERKAHEEEEEDEYIPRTPRRAQPQPSRRPQVQPLERRDSQTEWRPQPRTPEQPAAAAPQPQPAAPVLTPEEEGTPALARPQTPARPATQTAPVHEPEPETSSIDISDIDWRKAVIAAEILNRKY